MTKKQTEGEWNKIDIGLTEMNDWETNAVVSGKLAEIKHDIGPNNSTIYTLEGAEGVKVSFWGNSVLDSRLEKVELGVEVKVEYKGKVESKNGRSYRNFDVFTREVK